MEQTSCEFCGASCQSEYIKNKRNSNLHILYIPNGEDIPLKVGINTSEMKFSPRKRMNYLNEPHYPGFIPINMCVPNYILPPEVLSQSSCWIWHETCVTNDEKMCEKCFLSGDFSIVSHRSSGGNLSPSIFNVQNARYNWSILM